MFILDYIYRIFYTVISLSIVGLLLVPVVLLIRTAISKAPRRCMVWLWMLFFIRIICPVSLSSVLCVNTEWNRGYHILMRRAGLDMPDVTGIMTGWFTVFTSRIETSTSYRVCAIVWVAGATLIMLYAFARQCSLKRRLKNAKKVYGRVYQAEGLGCPVIAGVFIKKIYLPGDMKAADAKYVLSHMENHIKGKDSFLRTIVFIAMSIHWFNLLIWLSFYLFNVDIELSSDDRVIKAAGLDAAKDYAQEIINMCSKDSMPYSFYTFKERYARKRALRMLYYTRPLKKSKQIFILVWLLCFVWWFMLRPLQILWNGGMLNGSIENQKKESGLFAEDDNQTVAKLTTVSPEGLNRIVEIVMTDGTHKEGEGYDGSFQIVFCDSFGTELTKVSLNDVFRESVGEKLHFDEGMIMYADDYNGDGIQEVVIGQNIGDSDKSFTKATGEIKNKDKQQVNEYYMWDIEAGTVKKTAGPIYTTTKDNTEKQSCKFDVINRGKGIFGVKINGQSTYYKWNKSKETYIQKAYTSRQIKALKKKQSDEDEGSFNNTHTLKDSSGDTVVKVSTKKDDTQSEAIKSVEITPGDFAKKYNDIEGYYCDIQWAECVDTAERYAVLTYNGKKAQTFTVYDTKSQDIFYKNEDGNKMLGKIFREYNGTDISFNSDNIVVYSLKEIDGDSLTIDFAADTAEDTTIKGTFKYDVSSKRYSGFSYSQTK